METNIARVGTYTWPHDNSSLDGQELTALVNRVNEDGTVDISVLSPSGPSFMPKTGVQESLGKWVPGTYRPQQ